MTEPLIIQDYIYPLPPDRIALFPLPKRDESKLLVYRKGVIRHDVFKNLAHELEPDTLLVFNNTRVIQARILFQKESGAVIEVFLLNPLTPSTLLVESMQAIGRCSWKCTIGNLKRWTTGTVLTKMLHGTRIEAHLVDRANGEVMFKWNTSQSFAEIIEESGNTPLPPYLKRDPVDEDKDRYQTIYGKLDGAVAAPTAGLHFTPEVFGSLSDKNIKTDFLTLHVSAGTFQPVKETDARKHTMHKEQIVVTRSNIETLIGNRGPVIPVGTTSMRTLETLYWYGVKLSQDPKSEFFVGQEDAYSLTGNLSMKDALNHIVEAMETMNTNTLVGETAIYIRPGYTFQVCDGLVTNFHQPGSTLILLVAAFIGDHWRDVYDQALNNGYRFLSYGDSSLLLPETKKESVS